MAIGDTWRRALEYFGLVDGDYIEGDFTDENEINPTTGEAAPIREQVDPVRDRGNTPAPRSRATAMDDADDIFADEMPSRRRAATQTPPPDMGEAPAPSRAPAGNGGADVQMKLVAPRSFNDAQQVADEFKSQRPVILNLQDTNNDLARRLIDFCSGLTYALGGGMQKIANQTFLLTPANVRVSAAEAERMLERGFFNQS